MKTTKHTFFCDNITESKLSEEESHHAIRVLRLKLGDLITIVDGKGTSAIGKVSVLNKKGLSFEVLESIYQEPIFPIIEIAIAPTKNNDRFEYFLEKVTELGISYVTPLLCSNSERKNIKQDRFEKIVMSAAKQSGILYLPTVNKLTKFSDLISNIKDDVTYFIAHCEDDFKKNELKYLIKNQKNICILIGPEGDFTTEEINLAKANGIVPVSLGQTRLRTETAGVIACHTVKLIS
jgi:16S rRNA (uracil1498-N3)-methyltransferase